MTNQVIPAEAVESADNLESEGRRMTFSIERAIASILSQRGTNFNGLYQQPPSAQDRADARRLLEHFNITMKDFPESLAP